MTDAEINTELDATTGPVDFNALRLRLRTPEAEREPGKREQPSPRSLALAAEVDRRIKHRMATCAHPRAAGRRYVGGGDYACCACGVFAVSP